MEKIVFVHLSDIHFTGSSGTSVHDLDSEVRNELLRDAATVTKDLGGATGVLVTGDIAFSGQRAEYERAALWLLDFCRAIGCPDESVWVVPGNHDVGYVRMFDAHERTPGDGPTIGLILCTEENHTIARYSVLNEHKQLFAAKYVTHLPTEEELRRELERDRRFAETIVAESTTVAPRANEPTKPKRTFRSKGRKR